MDLNIKSKLAILFLTKKKTVFNKTKVKNLSKWFLNMSKDYIYAFKIFLDKI
jgi:hypothetical protein